METFAIPSASALITKKENAQTYILLQERHKQGDQAGLLEIPAGKIRAYENIFDALRREVKEETGLTISTIYNEEKCIPLTIGENILISFEPFCSTQNLSGAYPLIVHTFLCEATGELALQTNESRNIRWITTSELKSLLSKQPERFFLMHHLALQKFLDIDD